MAVRFKCTNFGCGPRPKPRCGRAYNSPDPKAVTREGEGHKEWKGKVPSYSECV